MMLQIQLLKYSCLRSLIQESKEREVMSPKLLVISTTYKTRVALEKPCKERKRTLIGQLTCIIHEKWSGV